MLRNIQLLRAFAALSVLTFHFSLLRVSALPIHPGAFGVDLFFVLSGFIIAYSAAREPRHFLQHRLIRVLPPYWIATLAGFLLVLPGTNAWATLLWLARSLVFLPDPHGRGTIIFVAWTLVYELAFYLLYALCLRASRRLAPLLCASLLLLLAFGVDRVGLASRSWPFLAEFAYGLVIFMLDDRMVAAERWPKPIPALLVGTGLIALYALDGYARWALSADFGVHRIVLWGFPAALVVLGLLVWERRGVCSRGRFFLLLGNASYAMYLLHPLLMTLLSPYRAGTRATRVAWFCCATGAAIACALLFYIGVEAPVIRCLGHRFLHDRVPLIALRGQ